MELNWTTLVLEVINFVILVWLLKRLFYRPLLAALDRRREVIEAQRDEARRLHEEADGLRQEYEQRLAVWEQERGRLRDELRRRIEKERAQLLEEAHHAAEAESERVRVAAERRLDEQAHNQELQALELGAGFAARLLQRLADPHLEARLIELFLEELPALQGRVAESLRRGERANRVEVASAFPLGETTRISLAEGLKGLAAEGAELDYRVDESLGAGLRIALGGWVLHANIADELRLFSGVGHEPR